MVRSGGELYPLLRCAVARRSMASAASEEFMPPIELLDGLQLLFARLYRQAELPRVQ